MFVTAIIPAAGKGRRFGSEINKQFLEIDGKPILYYTLHQFEISSLISEIILVVPETWLTSIPKLLIEKYQLKKISRVIIGGRERFESVFNGLKAVAPPTDIVVVHDGVRPLITVQLIEKAIQECQKYDAVALAVPIKDTVKIVQNGFIQQTLDRSLLRAIQTPQVFKFELLLKAYENRPTVSIPLTDDATLVEELGIPVKIVDGDYTNIKITSPEDLLLAEYLLRMRRK